GIHQEAIDTLQLLVHRDPERLEDPRGRMDAGAASWDRLLDQRGQLEGGSNGRATPALHDGPGDPPGASFVGILVEDARQLLFVRRPDRRRRAAAAGAIHAHVERLVTLEREPAPFGRELPGRNA